MTFCQSSSALALLLVVTIGIGSKYVDAGKQLSGRQAERLGMWLSQTSTHTGDTLTIFCRLLVRNPDAYGLIWFMKMEDGDEWEIGHNAITEEDFSVTTRYNVAVWEDAASSDRIYSLEITDIQDVDTGTYGCKVPRYSTEALHQVTLED